MTEEVFKYLQVFTAICDSFAHGANDCGSRSSYQMALGSNLAKNTFPIHSSSRHCKNRKTKASVPWTSCTPTTSTLPGVHDIDGPRAVRHNPEVDLIASE